PQLPHALDASLYGGAAPGVISPTLGKRSARHSLQYVGALAVKSRAMSHHSGPVWAMRTSSPSMSNAISTMCILSNVPWGTARAPLACTRAGFSARQCTRIRSPVAEALRSVPAVARTVGRSPTVIAATWMGSSALRADGRRFIQPFLFCLGIHTLLKDRIDRRRRKLSATEPG